MEKVQIPEEGQGISSQQQAVEPESKKAETIVMSTRQRGHPETLPLAKRGDLTSKRITETY